MDWLYEILQIQGASELLFVALDFVIVYLVIYQLLLLIKGTRTLPIVVGLIVVIVFYFLSQNQLWTLPTTHWFIDKFISNFIIIVVIIFQADIRRALAQFGRTSIFSASREIEDTQVLEEVIKASVMLSNRGIGALMVIERNADLTHYIEDAIGVDAVVTKDLLFSMFITEHQNPLHDGAVVIQHGRVAAAGCFLPLTNNPTVEKTLGTRHRAAIGLSEDTDAAIVIVSEESGKISIAYKEELYRDLDGNDMRDMLQKIFISRQEDAPEERKLLEKFQRGDGIRTDVEVSE